MDPRSLNNKTPRPKNGVTPNGRSGSNKPARTRAPEQTFEEVRYLKHLIDDEIPVTVKLVNNEEVSGTIEYYDISFIRLTRLGAPNLFIFKHEIKYLYES